MRGLAEDRRAFATILVSANGPQQLQRVAAIQLCQVYREARSLRQVPHGLIGGSENQSLKPIHIADLQSCDTKPVSVAGSTFNVPGLLQRLQESVHRTLHQAQVLGDFGDPPFQVVSGEAGEYIKHPGP